MWYRDVGGVVKRSAAVGINSQNRSDTPRVDDLVDKSPLHEPTIVRTPRHDTIEMAVSAQAPSSHEGNRQNQTGVLYSQLGELGDTLFCDGTANLGDIPDNLDWFFEMLDPGVVEQDNSSNTASDHLILDTPVLIPAEDIHESQYSLQTTQSNVWLIARERIIKSLQRLPQDILESSYFYPTTLEMLFHLYFENYHHHFPNLHRPSLSITESPPLLLASIITLGSTRADDPLLYEIGRKSTKSFDG